MSIPRQNIIEKTLTSFRNRREVMRAMLGASAGILLPPGTAWDDLPADKRMALESVRRRIGGAISNGEATGTAIAVAYGGRIVVEEGYGWANRTAALKATARTPFSLASITKAFTATTLMTLVAEGKLSLDEPANMYLAQSRIEGSNGDATAATVRLLGAHASGLPGMYESYERNEMKLALSPDGVIREYGRLAYPPGGCYEYSNIAFAAVTLHLNPGIRSVCFQPVAKT